MVTGVGGELGEALVHVGRAAAIVRLQAVNVGVAFGVVELPSLYIGGDLVDLLHILVAAHVGGKGGGQGIVGDQLQQVGVGRVAGDGEKLLQGIHQLHHGAKLNAVGRIGAA